MCRLCALPPANGVAVRHRLHALPAAVVIARICRLHAPSAAFVVARMRRNVKTLPEHHGSPLLSYIAVKYIERY